MTGPKDAPLSSEDVRMILDLVERSEFDTLDLSIGDLRLVVSKTGSAASPSAVPAAPASRQPAATPQATADAAQAPALPAASNVGAEEGLIDIEAPIVGTFYIAPEPGARPFVEIGAVVSADDTVGLIEVMKVFNAVKAGQAGVITERLVENAGVVEYGQPLFRLRPEAG
jgi:acetyl-CoA carboxylase biotin carboxyl carrier protein